MNNLPWGVRALVGGVLLGTLAAGGINAFADPSNDEFGQFELADTVTSKAFGIQYTLIFY